MNSYSNLNSGVHSDADSSENIDANNRLDYVNQNNHLIAEHYVSMDLCSQAQMSKDANNILNRMHKLRVFAKEQQAKRVKSQRQQTSFCF